MRPSRTRSNSSTRSSRAERSCTPNSWESLRAACHRRASRVSHWESIRWRPARLTTVPAERPPKLSTEKAAAVATRRPSTRRRPIRVAVSTRWRSSSSCLRDPTPRRPRTRSRLRIHGEPARWGGGEGFSSGRGTGGPSPGERWPSIPVTLGPPWGRRFFPEADRPRGLVHRPLGKQDLRNPCGPVQPPLQGQAEGGPGDPERGRQVRSLRRLPGYGDKGRLVLRTRP